MSHIVSFSIVGLAGRQAVYEKKLNRDNNVFFGLNGSGKTSLLKILHSAMANDASTLRSVPFVSAKVRIYSLSYKRTFTRTLTKPVLAVRAARRWPPSGEEFQVVAEAPNDTSLIWKCTTKAKDAQSTQWQHRYLPTDRLYLADESVWSYTSEGLRRPGEYFTEDDLDAVFASAVEGLWTRYSAEVLDEVRLAQEKGLTSILKVVLASKKTKRKSRPRTLEPQTAYDRVKKFLARQRSSSIIGSFASFQKRYKIDENLQNVVADIDQVETRIGEAMASRDHLRDLIEKMYTQNKHIRFDERSIQVETPDGAQIGLASLSSGEKHLLRIFVETLLASQSSIIIDEPEISMHVDWQKELVAAMRSLNPSAQFIIATHSPEIMSDIPDDKIFHI